MSEPHHLALAVDHAGAYIVRSLCTLDEDLKISREHSSDLLKEATDLQKQNMTGW